MLNATLDAAAIAERIPHGRPLSLLDRVVSVDERRIHCEARSHRDPGNPLRTGGRLGAACAVEYAAQAMALHSALTGEGDAGPSPEPGLLVALRDLELAVARLDDQPAPLHVRCERESASRAATAYRFVVTGADGTPLATGRATLVPGTPPGDVA